MPKTIYEVRFTCVEGYQTVTLAKLVVINDVVGAGQMAIDAATAGHFQPNLLACNQRAVKGQEIIVIKS